ncbi:hypothetical protein [Enhygromyxa salina]|uniref:hypothetical protein n=1 Tax=Enhygromyxa salina TaxID=215803 RepID=UPI0011B1CB7B|nr:hypothetical protein [Enhygromyxa salina]
MGDDDHGADEGEPQSCASISTPVGEGAGEQRLELVATREQIPGIADQPTARGRSLGVLHAFDGRLQLGYGDYSDNTGPIAMPAWDPRLGAFVDMGVLPTEEVSFFHAAHGALYSPAIDPDGHQESGGVYRLDCGAAAWSVQTPIPGAVHVYAVASQGETLYASTGSVNGAPALLMASDDRGASWTELLRRESDPDRYSRFYFMAATPELLFVSGRDYPNPGESFAWIRRGGRSGAFEALDDPPDGSLVPVVLGDELVIARFSGSPGISDHLASYRVEGQAFVAHEPWPVPGSVAKLITWAPQVGEQDQPERLLVLMARPDGGASVHRSADLAAGPEGWSELVRLDALDGDEFVSMALVSNDLYLGTREGSLWAVRELESAPAGMD